MAMQTYGLSPQRVGIIKGRILKHATPVIMLGKVGAKDDFQPNAGDNVKYRRWVPKGGTAEGTFTGGVWNGDGPNVFFGTTAGVDRGDAYAISQETAEGVTTGAETLVPQDLSVSLRQFAVLYGYSDKTADMYEDDVPQAMTEFVGERLGLVQEMVLYGQLKGCTNKFYSGAAATSTTTVTDTITLSGLRKIARTLKANHAKRVSKMVLPSSGFASTPVEAGFPVFIHTDLEASVRELPGFRPWSDYGKSDNNESGEFGKCEEFRFFSSPELVPILGATGVTAATASAPGMAATSGFVDVYKVIVGSQDAWGHVGLKGSKALDVVALTPGQTDKFDPLGQRGYVGAKFYYNAIVLNNLQMAVYEVCTLAL